MTRLVKKLRSSWEKNWPEFYCALTGGVPKFVFARKPGGIGSSIPVFVYHAVNARVFEADLAFLHRNGYTTITSDRLLDYLCGRRQAPERSVVLSIDDGARNLYDVAFPLLKQYRSTAVAFIATSLHEEASNAADNPSSGIASSFCSWSHIREMHGSGHVDIQSHTHEHRYVPRWPESTPLTFSASPFSMEEDFRLARETIERQLNKKVRHLAFPKYGGTDAAVRVGQACGYEAFWWGTLRGRPGNSPGDPPTHVVRVSGEFLRRLPGDGRVSLANVLRARYWRSIARLYGGCRADGAVRTDRLIAKTE